MRAVVSAFVRSVAEQDGPLDLRGDGAGADESGLLRERGGGRLVAPADAADTYRAMVDPPPGPSGPRPVHPAQALQPPGSGDRCAGGQTPGPRLALCDMEHDRPRLEQGTIAFFMGRNLKRSWDHRVRADEVTPGRATVIGTVVLPSVRKPSAPPRRGESSDSTSECWISALARWRRLTRILRRDFISRNPRPFTDRRARIRAIVHLA
jgi:hypothetical protein